MIAVVNVFFKDMQLPLFVHLELLQLHLVDVLLAQFFYHRVQADHLKQFEVTIINLFVSQVLHKQIQHELLINNLFVREDANFLAFTRVNQLAGAQFE